MHACHRPPYSPSTPIYFRHRLQLQTNNDAMNHEFTSSHASTVPAVSSPRPVLRPGSQSSSRPQGSPALLVPPRNPPAWRSSSISTAGTGQPLCIWSTCTLHLMAPWPLTCLTCSKECLSRYNTLKISTCHGYTHSLPLQHEIYMLESSEIASLQETQKVSASRRTYTM